jgi:hypothetical protein
MLPTIGTNLGYEECEFYLIIYIYIKNDGQNHPKGDKKEEAKERPRDTQPEGPKERGSANLSCGRKLFHPWPL